MYHRASGRGTQIAPNLPREVYNAHLMDRPGFKPEVASCSYPHSLVSIVHLPADFLRASLIYSHNIQTRTTAFTGDALEAGPPEDADGRIPALVGLAIFPLKKDCSARLTQLEKRTPIKLQRP
ncbi:hypothetical protein AcV5_002860 [Taiwanofungus camphoratus]|nr:hypothetical protein AcV5_002860 [Antrodia cinnamomea]